MFSGIMSTGSWNVNLFPSNYSSKMNKQLATRQQLRVQLVVIWKELVILLAHTVLTTTLKQEGFSLRSRPQAFRGARNKASHL